MKIIVKTILRCHLVLLYSFDSAKVMIVMKMEDVDEEEVWEEEVWEEEEEEEDNDSENDDDLLPILEDSAQGSNGPTNLVPSIFLLRMQAKHYIPDRM